MSFFVEHIEVIIINFFLVFLLFFFYHKYIERKMSRITHETSIGLISAFSIILCMTFPISPVVGFIFDMRQVPFIVGSLYGGRRVSLFLLVVLLSYRGFIEIDHGFFASIIIYLLVFLALILLIPYFQHAQSILRKVVISIMLAVASFIILVIVVFTFDPNFSIRDMFFLLLFYSSQYFFISIFVYTIEKTRNKILIMEELQKLEKLRIVSEMAASISHEVRNPITVTRGFIQMLRSSNLSEEEKNRYIDISLNELENAERIITDYLTFAKPSLDNVSQLDLNEELKYAISVVTPYATMKNVEINYSGDSKIYILGESQKIRQCLLNVMKNGIEAMETGGTLKVQLSKTEQHAVISIEDTGIGMTEEQVNQLGTPYYSLKDKGTGLGTMVVFSIIRVMRGEIHIDSEIGKGTRFTITLPLVKE